MSLWTCLCLAIIAIILAPVRSEGITGVCSVTQHECDSGRCIPIKWRCDQDDDCGDGSDETDCAPVTCSDAEFQCGNGHCILKRWLCDGEDDCRDNSDEDESICANNTCKEDQFQCGVGGECIPMNWQCDGQEDCTGGEDEKACAAATCPSGSFMCATSKTCITERWRCDQDKDCDDGSDEEGCEETLTCPPNEFRCNSTERCIPSRWRCDGDVDCKDGSDENQCPSRAPAASQVCSNTEFQCTNFECIHKAWKCDGDEDCTDGSDELGCGELQCEPDEFRCHDQCIHGSLQCDGRKDCNGGEDEEGCAPPPSHCDSETEFDCYKDGKMCIPISKLCDHENDCGNHEDEPAGPDSFCTSPNPCDTNNGGCKHTCHYNKYSPHWCSCKPGYELDKDNKTCNDINECEVAGTCSQHCDNVRGGYKCSCLAGYTLDPKGRYCRAGGREPYLLFANRHDLREIRLDSGDYRAVVQETRSAIAIDFDYEDNYVYWSDVAQESIMRARYNHSHAATTNHTEAVVTDLTTPDGIAVDWVHKLLYWTDTGRNTIEVMDLRSASRHRLTLFNTGLDEPRSIMVDPRADQGWIYWTDWGNEPKIERAGMDGNHRQAIITSELQWPNGMTIDYVSKKLFWVDAKLHTIMSSNLDGSRQQIILNDRHYLSHPFSISVFEDTLYWTDWQTESIHKTNKFNGSAVSNVAISLFSPMDIHVFHELKQPKDASRCGNNNGGCSHFCLPSPMITSASARYSCACPNGWKLTDNGRTCVSLEAATKSDVITVSSIDKNQGPNSSGDDKEEVDNMVGKSTGEPAMGNLAFIISGAIAGILIFVAIIGFIIYRSILRRNVQSMNFDNPVYRKTTEDQFSLEKNQFQPNKLPATLEPLTAGQTEEV